MEQRHRPHQYVARSHAHPLGGQPCVAEHPEVAQQHTFREARGARGVLDLHPVTRPQRGQGQRRVGFGAKPVELLQRHHLPQVRQVRADLGDDVRHPVAPVLRDVEQTRTAGLAQHVAQLARLVGRVDRHQHQPGQGGPVLQQDPLQGVARPHRHVLARPKPPQQRTGHPLGLAQQLRVAQPPPRSRTRRPLHHCGAVRDLRRCRTQRITDGLLHQRPRRVPTPVGQPPIDPAACCVPHRHPHSMRPHRRQRRDADGAARAWPVAKRPT